MALEENPLVQEQQPTTTPQFDPTKIVAVGKSAKIPNSIAPPTPQFDATKIASVGKSVDLSAERPKINIEKIPVVKQPEPTDFWTEIKKSVGETFRAPTQKEWEEIKKPKEGLNIEAILTKPIADIPEAVKSGLKKVAEAGAEGPDIRLVNGKMVDVNPKTKNEPFAAFSIHAPLKGLIGAGETIMAVAPPAIEFNLALNAAKEGIKELPHGESINNGLDNAMNGVTTLSNYLGADLKEGSTASMFAELGDLAWQAVMIGGAHKGVKYGIKSMSDLKTKVDQAKVGELTEEQQKKLAENLDAIKDVTPKDIIEEAIKKDTPESKEIAAKLINASAEGKTEPLTEKQQHDLLYDFVSKGDVPTEEFKQKLDALKANGQITEADHFAGTSKLDFYKKEYDQIKQLGLSDEENRKAMGLSSDIAKKQDLIDIIEEDKEYAKSPMKVRLLEKAKGEHKILAEKLDEIMFGKKEGAPEVKPVEPTQEPIVSEISKTEEPQVELPKLVPTDKKVVEVHHGTDTYDAAEQVGGTDNTKLMPEVDKQAQLAGIEMGKQGVTDVHTSAIGRATKTANKIGDRFNYKINPALDAWDIGNEKTGFEGMDREKFKPIEEYFQDHPNETTLPKDLFPDMQDKKLNESWGSLVTRLVDLHNELVSDPKAPETIGILTHSKNMKILDAMRKNGGEWNEKAKEDYRKDEVKSAEVRVHEGETKTTKYEATKQGAGKTGVTETGTGVTEKKAKTVRAGTSKSKRKIVNPRAIEALKIDAKTPHEAALQYFIGKGQLHPSAMGELYGGGKKKFPINEMRSRIGYIKKSGLTIEGIAHKLWENQEGGHEGQFDIQDLRNAVEDVVNSHISTRTMIDDLLERNKQHIEEDSFYADIPEDYDLVDEAKDIWSELPDEEKVKVALLETPEDVDKYLEENPPIEESEKTIQAKELEGLIEKKESEISASRTALENKAKELDKALMADQEDLFGERKSTTGGMFDERADASQREKVLQPLKDILEKQTTELKDLQDKLKGEEGKQDLNLFEEKTPLDIAKEKLAEAKRKLDEDRNKLGIAPNPEERANKLFEYHKALVDVAKEWIKEKGGDLSEFLKDTGEKLNVSLQKAWDEASGKNIIKSAKELGYDNPNEAIAEPKVTGISHEAMVRTAAELGIEAPERGEGTTTEAEIAKGRELLSKGENPQQIVEEFKRDGKISADAMSIVRAHQEQLVKDVYKAVEDFGENSPEDQTASSKLEQWQKDIKPMATAWSNIGKGMMGVTDIDTGTFVGIRTAFKEEHGIDLTPAQNIKAKELSNQVKTLTDEVENLKTKLTDALNNAIEEESKKPENIKEKTKKLASAIRKGKIHRPGIFSAASPASLVWDGAIEVAAKTIEAGGKVAQAISDAVKHMKESDWYKQINEERKNEAEKALTNYIGGREKIKNTPEELAIKFADKKDSKFELQDVKDIWAHAKEAYIDQGKSYADMLSGVSKDLGLSVDQVRNALSQPKGARVLTNEMYKKQSDRIKAVNAAKEWVKTARTPKLIKFFKSLPGAFFAMKTFGHGTVGMVTHAGANMFKPTQWGTYWPNFMRQFKYAFGSEVEYHKAMENLVNDPDYIMWQRAGLAVDPYKVTDDYQTFKKYFGRISDIGDRGFNALKVYRLDLAKSIYEPLSEIEKSDPNTIKEIAKLVNHSTGSSNVIVPKALNVAFFAPRLEAARWQKLIVQPANAIKTFSNWAKATPADRAAAKIVARRAGETIGTMVALLAANQGLLSASGSKQKINFTNPQEQDWFKFKVGNRTLDASGGMISTVKFIYKLLNASLESQKSLHGKQRKDLIFSALGNYGRGKLSPFAATAFDFATHTNFNRDVLPPFKDKPGKGAKHLTWREYLLQEQTPIPIAEAIKSVNTSMKERGMTQAQIDDIMGGILDGVISGGTGIHVGESPKKR